MSVRKRVRIKLLKLNYLLAMVPLAIMRNITIDGKSNWLEGAMLIAMFATLSIVFYFHG